MRDRTDTPTAATSTLPRADGDALLDELLELLEIPSPTGLTEAVAAHVAGTLEAMGLAVMRTRGGALRTVIHGRQAAPARAIVAHLDTLGAQVIRLKPGGRVALCPVGTWSARFAEGARASLHTDSGQLRGTILPLKASGHIFNDEVDTQPVNWDNVELRLDVTADTPDDLAAKGVRVGDFVSIDPQPEVTASGHIVSRHLDNKGGAAALLAALAAITHAGPPPYDVHWIFTVREEVGVGATAVLPAEVAELVAVDIGTAGPGQAATETGVTLAMGDQSGPFDRGLSLALDGLAGAHGIPLTRDMFRHYLSDAAAAERAGADVRTALVTFGVDASHGYERVHRSALTDLADLLIAWSLSEPRHL